MAEEAKKGIHPLMAGAAVAVIVASGVGVAAMTGNLPGTKADDAATATAGSAAPAPQVQKATPPKQHVASASKPKCIDCGVVSAVNVVEVKGEGSGLGAVAGGVAGAVIGDQVGEGKNRKLLTVAGAAGGAIAGHEIEKYAKTHKRFDLSVRMDDGTTKTVSSETEPVIKVGQRVRMTQAGVQPL
jgi:outer membrane lipoprotein SlyB